MIEHQHTCLINMLTTLLDRYLLTSEISVAQKCFEVMLSFSSLETQNNPPLNCKFSNTGWNSPADGS